MRRRDRRRRPSLPLPPVPTPPAEPSRPVLGAPPSGPVELRVVRWVTVTLLVAGVAYLLATGARLPSREEIQELLAPFGRAAIPVFGLAYGATSAIGIPVTLLIATSVWLFGLGIGFAVAWGGTVLGTIAGFWLARFLGREWVLRRLSGRRRLRRFFEQVEEYGAIVVLLLRALPSPLPFAVINFLLGVTGIRFLPYLVASAIGMVPTVLAYAFAASQLLSPLAGEARWWRQPEFWAAVAVLLLMLVGLPLLVRRLDRASGGQLLARVAARLTGAPAGGAPQAGAGASAGGSAGAATPPRSSAEPDRLK